MSSSNYAEVDQFFGRPIRKIVADAVLTGGAVIVLTQLTGGLPGLTPQSGFQNVALQGISVSMAVIAGNIAEDMLEKANVL